MGSSQPAEARVRSHLTHRTRVTQSSPLRNLAVPAFPIPDSLLVTDVVENSRSGLQFSENENLPVPRPVLLEQTRQYIRMRRGQMTSSERLMWMTECLARPADDFYCELSPERKLLLRKAKADAKAEASVQAAAGVESPVAWTPTAVAQLLTRADLKDLKKVPESQIHRALKLFPDWSGLASLADQLKNSSSCPSISLLTALGQKAEEFLPDPKFRQTAIGLYSRAAACTEAKDESSHKARFRLSLMYVWENQCHSAEPYLKQLSDLRDGEFSSRSLYWKAFCARASGNKLLEAGLMGRLQKEYPLSYHQLVLSKAKSKRTWSLLDSREPEVQMRSKIRPDLNWPIACVEALQAAGAFDLAAEVLEQGGDDRFESTEAAFRLYMAVLYQRSGSMIHLFKTLAGVFRDDPGAISRSTLQLFYPLERFDVLKKHRSAIDPFLVAALIRQESGFNPGARSAVGAMGLMQLMPDTARRLERRRFSARSLLDPAINVRLGVKYFRSLLDRFDMDAELALAAYNAGPEKVDEWKRRYPVDDRVLFMDLIPFAETRNYVALIGRNYYWYHSLYGASLEPVAAVSALAAARRPATGKDSVWAPKGRVFPLLGTL